MVEPTAAALATAEPDTAPNSALATQVICASEPGNQPTTTLARSISRLAMPPVFIMLPARMKSGMATSVKLSRLEVMRCADITSAVVMSGMKLKRVSTVATPMQKLTGTPKISNKAKTTGRMSRAVMMLGLLSWPVLWRCDQARP